MSIRERELGCLTVATINTLFDGISVENRSVASWVLLHVKTFAGRAGYVQKEQQLRVGQHPVEQIIQKYQPQVLVANEVIRAAWGSETVSLFDEYGYVYRGFGLPEKPKDTLARNTLVASRLAGQPVAVPISNPTGGHFCALQLEDSDILVLGIQASAFFPRVRFQQITEVFAFCDQKVQEGLQVVVAGDFNCELTRDEGVRIPQRLSHLTKPSYPHPNLLKRIKESPRIIQKLSVSLLSFFGGRQRSLDHILIPSDWTVLSFDSEVTSSDHLGLIARVDFGNM